MLNLWRFKKTFIFAVGLSLLLKYDYHTSERLITRNLNTLRCGIRILWDYKVRFNSENCMAIHEEVARDVY